MTALAKAAPEKLATGSSSAEQSGWEDVSEMTLAKARAPKKRATGSSSVERSGWEDGSGTALGRASAFGKRATGSNSANHSGWEDGSGTALAKASAFQKRATGSSNVNQSLPQAAGVDEAARPRSPRDVVNDIFQTVLGRVLAEKGSPVERTMGLRASVRSSATVAQIASTAGFEKAKAVIAIATDAAIRGLAIAHVTTGANTVSNLESSRNSTPLTASSTPSVAFAIREVSDEIFATCVQQATNLTPIPEPVDEPGEYQVDTESQGLKPIIESSTPPTGFFFPGLRECTRTNSSLGDPGHEKQMQLLSQELRQSIAASTKLQAVRLGLEERSIAGLPPEERSIARSPLGVPDVDSHR